ncbi:hypothetical protein [Halalkalicoccus jeotgali]|uniref:DUF7975 domain-containing protein n=1 Tax=Halalkalicoccus jeotgali (strain DSM 18796 / CECT 7217 / JCM 14584 / KCTC 4019 / B3) TaxID=795797 RepID=D8JA10_HALJB|nr:hypothetical protein [Halalkalicoccus jeotgali]ADJ14532.1 hypothetical protein HacjB3_05705 [Halalkalicoccus jeotgali B3]ELY40104.1 hypothetical protein C497_04070 [Halalkalicoccus jeotgali B3]
MTRFCADSESDRKALFADAIAAHRARESRFCTFEADTEGPTWMQVGGNTMNLDCTDEELYRLEGLLDEFAAFSIEELTRPENAEGTNVRIQAYTDEERLAEFVERCFRTVYEQPTGYVAWVTEV